MYVTLSKMQYKLRFVDFQIWVISRGNMGFVLYFLEFCIIYSV